jgi:nucleotide-binding universal stress UspA family protein
MAGRFSRILVPTDFGAASDAALECAKELARRFDGRLYVLHVVEDPMATGVWTPDVYIAASAELRDRLLHDAKERLDAIFGEAERKEFNPLTEVRTGGAGDVIGEFARETTIDLIVMGTHGRRGLSHMFLGSVAERMVRTAPCPVLTLRAARRHKVIADPEPVATIEPQPTAN